MDPRIEVGQVQDGVVIGIDLGGTKIAAACVSSDGAMLDRELIPTDADQGREAVIDRLVRVVDALRGRSDRPVLAVGVGAPAPLSPSEGIVWEAPNLPGWERVPIRAIMEQRTGLPLALENDARAAGLAEVRVGAGRGVRDMLFVTVGTGIGGAVIVDGRLLRGATETAGEIGHMVMDPEGPLCGCGNRGCLEQFAAGPAIERRAVQLLAKYPTSELASISPDAMTGELVAEAAQRGDPVGQQSFQEAGAWLGVGIASVANLLNPALVVIGGGVAQVGDLLLGPLEQAVQRHTLQRAAQGLRIVPAQLGTDAGILGAAMAAWDSRQE